MVELWFVALCRLAVPGAFRTGAHSFHRNILNCQHFFFKGTNFSLKGLVSRFWTVWHQTIAIALYSVGRDGCTSALPVFTHCSSQKPPCSLLWNLHVAFLRSRNMGFQNALVKVFASNVNFSWTFCVGWVQLLSIWQLIAWQLLEEKLWAVLPRKKLLIE